MKDQVNVFWFRRDLRLHDNAALYHALKQGKPVLPIFIFDKAILDALEDKADRRVSFIHHSIAKLQQQLVKLQSSLRTFYGFPTEAFKQIIREYNVGNVYTNHDYEPYAKERDDGVKALLSSHNVGFFTYKDQVVFEKEEVLKPDGKPYTVFTPYSRSWKAKLNEFYLSAYPTKKYFHRLINVAPQPLLSFGEIGFQQVDFKVPDFYQYDKVIKSYDTTRDYPGDENSTTRLGVHLRFGTISVRQLATRANALSSVYLNELIWREFYQMILWHFPYVADRAFKPEYYKVEWRNNEQEFERWCAGTTGYPLVDAGMRQLNATGYMHNRVRMVVASFLTKHLLIDWRWGEAYFAQKLLDYELASNNGGWQWAAGSGCDAAPFFRIFNPHLQAKKFDEDHKYITRWIPELNDFSYPEPIVEHEFARKRALEVYSKAVRK